MPTRGPRPNTSFIGASLGADTLTSGGQVKVTSTLQLPMHPHIFAGGDIIDWPEQKQAGKCRAHTNVITANVLSLLAGQKPSKVYQGSYEMIIITFGKVCVHIGVLSLQDSG
jgi:NADH dehydrogenase FAD-containing subunit